MNNNINFMHSSWWDYGQQLAIPLGLKYIIKNQRMDMILNYQVATHNGISETNCTCYVHALFKKI